MATEDIDSGDAFARYVGAQVRGEAAMRGISVVALAAAMSMDRVTLHRYLTGKRPMPIPALYQAARVVGVEPHDILGRAEARMAAEMSPGADTVLAAHEDDSLVDEIESHVDEP